jgi:hypothetical protein
VYQVLPHLDCHEIEVSVQSIVKAEQAFPLPSGAMRVVHGKSLLPVWESQICFDFSLGG